MRFPSFTDETDKTASMQAEAVAARQLLTVIGRVASGVLHSSSGARAGGGKAAGDDDDGGDGDDDDVGSGGGDSNAEKIKAPSREAGGQRQQLQPTWTRHVTRHARGLQ